MKRLSIILPIYNVEAYIKVGLESIFRQGLDDDDFEVILVNDGTPDNSIGVVEDIIRQHQNIIVINQENQGISKARNSGFYKSQGEYVYFMDPDDLLVDNALSVLLKKTESSNVDILMADYHKFKDGEDYNKLTNIHQEDSDTLKTAEQAYLEDLNPYECYVWLMLYKRSFLINKGIEFKPFLFEDTLFCQESFIKATTVLRTHLILYLYRKRAGSSTFSINFRSIMDMNKCLAALNDIRYSNSLKPQIRKKLSDNMFISLSFGLWYLIHDDELYAQRRIVISDLKKRIKPSSFIFRGSIKQIIVSYAIRYFPYVYLRLRRIR